MQLQYKRQSLNAMHLFIVADDVTGAADSAARVHRAGLTATINVLPQPVLPNTTVVALSTDSRFLSPAAAAQQVTKLVQPLAALAQDEQVIWYKKIDSTLRGNIGAELAAMLAAVTPAGVTPCAIICPAFPAQGRGLVDGALVYADAPPQAPHLPTLLAAQSALPLATVTLAEVRAGVAALQYTLTTLHQQGVQLLVVDGVTDADLGALCAAATLLPHALLCGSAGLVGVLAATLAPPEGRSKRAPFPLRRPLLAVVGSGSPMAHRQIAALRGATTMAVIEIDPAARSLDMPTLRNAAVEDCTLHLPPPQPDLPLEGERARSHVQALTRLAVAALKNRQPATLLIVGGDTAVHLLTALGVTQLQVEEELLPGMPVCTGHNADGRSFTVILKAGNHGDAETLVALYQRIG